MDDTLVFVTLLCATACAIPAGTVRMASTHYVAPTETVTPSRFVTGQAKKLCGLFFITWGVPGSKMMSAAIDHALSKEPGSKLLIDAQSDASIYLIPLLFARCRVFVSGTAATR